MTLLAVLVVASCDTLDSVVLDDATAERARKMCHTMADVQVGQPAETSAKRHAYCDSLRAGSTTGLGPLVYVGAAPPVISAPDYPACFYEHPECASCGGSGYASGWGQPPGSPQCKTCEGHGFVLCDKCLPAARAGLQFLKDIDRSNLTPSQRSNLLLQQIFDVSREKN